MQVPSIPWSGDGLTAELTAEGTIPEEVFNKAMVTTVEEVRDTWHSGSRNQPLHQGFSVLVRLPI